MAKLIKMPEIAANATSAVIKAWTKQEGDAVKVGDVLAEIETDKALIEFDADEAGVLGKILAPAGKDIEVGAPIAVLFAVGETNVDIDAVLAAAGVASAPAPAAAIPLAAIPEANVSGAAIAVPPAAPAAATSAAAANGGRIFASPLARRVARERGVDLGALQGSGPRGRIVKRDVEGAPAAPAAAAVQAAAPAAAQVAAGVGAAYVEVAHSGMRRTIARRLTESKSSIPHFYLKADCRMDKLIALRTEINASAPRKISINDFIVKAAAATLRAVPEANVSWTDTAMRKYAQADISVAVSTEGGLITPVVRAAEGKSLSTISAEIADLAARARSNALSPEEYQGGSFTISNLGMFGMQEFSAIINPPQAAILAVGATEQRAVVVDGALAVASMMTVTLSVDHRAIDGAVGAQWLAQFKQYIENPLSILI
ncbi:pyruvate dehydrogenase complex dihydrolipoamide acetyltransferase [Janthinobacterium sp. 17J80-10]|uniref:pyruvate dehydrogenase complex dihydrolipoamide acetyltransferase n=1 Tax=Janthinobacterium sp. 17J80-10 TaxID=2497863 RepID=UPI0010053581|nr:pyruvate dehydrogenase complex dihydrolipoamide acetyltransferase [Janthinobacterium sp. 17J80-10]QAU32806.1 pyruvate dehydrogenase complex dihydrolipoamide acetyltransferase [Janthinobacterium sp. 17J80-10]